MTERLYDQDPYLKEFTAKVRIDTPKEVQYYQHGGILPFVLRQLLERHG